MYSLKNFLEDCSGTVFVLFVYTKHIHWMWITKTRSIRRTVILQLECKQYVTIW